jgi:hypothetical protein
MVRKLILLLPVLLGAAVALADGPVTEATASSESEKAVTAEVAKEPAKKSAAKSAAKSVKGDEQAQVAPGTPPVPPGGDVKMSGMSILGNEDAPKSLVLVPWKSSQLADMPGVSRLLDSSTQPVDKEVFMRELSYYEFKAGTK